MYGREKKFSSEGSQSEYSQKSHVEDSKSKKGEWEQAAQMLQMEKEHNPEYRDCLKRLEQEYERRVAKAVLFIERLSDKMEDFDWFVVPPVMNRTDYGYGTDIDLVIVHGQQSKIPEFENYVDDVFVMPRFISREEISRMSSKYPEVGEWYQKKIAQEKPTGDSRNEKQDVLSLEDKLRYSIESTKRARVRDSRLRLADYLMDAVKKRIDILSWRISGSTVGDTEKFSVCSDLDLDVLVDPKTSDQEREIFFYFHNYLTYKFAEDFGVNLDIHEDSLESIRELSRRDAKMGEFFERHFGIKI